MKLKNNYWLFLLLAVPAFFVFHAFFLPGTLAWGDAPFYSPEALRDLFNEPFAWVNQGTLGRINDLYWIYPISLLYGALHRFLSLNNDILMRLLFYFPAMLGSLIFPAILARYFGFSKIVQFFSSLVYTFNTYFILLIDGGQVGVALAYGLFPLGFLFLCRLKDKPSINSIYQALGVFLLLTIADARLSVMCLLSFLVWVTPQVFTKVWKPTIRHAKSFAFFCFALLGLSAYWIFPAIKLLGEGGGSLDSPLQLLSLLNPLFLFQPHWPANEFGKVFPIPFYFVGVPLLVFGSLIFKKKASYILTFCVLVFTFLVKGTTPPLGSFYELFLAKVPLGEAFRDSSKFFAPTILFSSLLVGTSVASLSQWATKRSKTLGKVLLAASATYFLMLIAPALKGNLTGVLSGRVVTPEITSLNSLIQSDPETFRTVWFPEKHPWGYSTFQKPAVDAKTLVDARPFASINTGTQDRFNFLHNPLSPVWLRLFGAKYMIFPGDTRKTLETQEQSDWNNLLTLVSSNKNLKRVSGQSIPVFKLEGIKPKIFELEKMYFVLGSDNIYDKLKKQNENFSPGEHGFIFLEDGKTDPEKMKNIASGSAALVFNEKEELDLRMTFLRKYFLTPTSASKWAVREASEFIKWKYELLVNGIQTLEFDFGKGIAFSTQAGEPLMFNTTAEKDGEYILAIRATSDKVKKVDINLNGESFDIDVSEGKFSWHIREKVQLKKGSHTLTVNNPGGTTVVNTAALIPILPWNQSQGLIQETLEKFQTYNLKESVAEEFANSLANSSKPVAYEQASPVRYKVKPEGIKGRWIVFTDLYNPLWRLQKSRVEMESFPLHSSINSFYMEYGWGEAEIFFKGQKEVRWGLYFTSISILLLAVIFFYKKAK